MILLPGVLSQRTARKSALLFAWDAADASLEPITGQTPSLTAVASTNRGNVTPGVGTTVTAGRAMPRFGQSALSGVPTNFLELSGLTASQDTEQLSYDFDVAAQDLSVLLRLTGLWTAGASLSSGYVMSVGNGSSGAGAFRLQRNTTNWTVQRTTGGGTATASLAENANLVWPADVLVTYVQATGVAAVQIRGANGTLYGPATTSGFIATGRFAGATLYLGSDGANGLGQPLRLYSAKVAYGVQTYAQIDALV